MAENKAVGVTYSAVLRSLDDDAQVRSDVTRMFKALGGDRDRWARRDKLAMADALTRVEDALEIARPRYDRARIKAVRRALEMA